MVKNRVYISDIKGASGHNRNGRIINEMDTFDCPSCIQRS